MKVKRFKSFRFKMVMYMFFSLIATFITEGLIFMGIYLYETEIIAGEYKKVWGASGQGKMSFGTFTMSQSIALDAWVIAIFTILLLIIYFILISNKFVTYVREIISGVERMKSGDLMEEIPVRGEDEFSEIAASINEMRHNLYETMEAQKAVEKTKDELITNVAHDLRTPLTSILGYLDLLTQGDFLTEEQKQKYLGIVSSKAKQLETLVKDLFDYTRYDRNKVKIKKEILDLNLFVPQLVDEFYPSFMDHQLECRTDFYEGALNIEGNGELLARAIGNLISNAIKFSHKDTVVMVHVKIQDVADENKTGEGNGKEVLVTVSDRGCGIKKEDQGKLLNEATHFTTFGTNSEEGSGLGLLLCKDFVSKNHGRLWFTSEEGIGSNFNFTIPIK